MGVRVVAGPKDPGQGLRLLLTLSNVFRGDEWSDCREGA